MKKRLAIIALALVVIMSMTCVLFACADDANSGNTGNNNGGNNNGGNNGGNNNTPGTYNLKVWCAELDREMIDEMLYAYEEANPNNNYNWTVQNVGEDVAGGRVIQDPTQAADVFSFASDQLGSLVTNNAILAVPTQYQSAIADEQIPIADTAAKFNGQYYAYPYTYENCFLYYNKSLLSANQLGSIESILAANTGAEYNLGINMDDSYYTSIFMFTAGMELFGADSQDANSVDLNNSKALAGCQYIYNLSSMTNGSKFKSILENEQSTAFRNGNVAAIISGPHMVAEFKSALGANYAVAKLPTIKLNNKATQMVSFSGVKLYGVNRNTAHAAEAAKLAAFLSNYDNQSIRLNDREFCPTNAQLYEEAMDSGVEAVEVVIEQAEFTRLKPAFTAMSSYWTPMADFLAGVYKKNFASSTWATKLQAIEDGLADA